jgi:hypothetical protein
MAMRVKPCSEKQAALEYCLVLSKSEWVKDRTLNFIGKIMPGNWELDFDFERSNQKSSIDI